METATFPDWNKIGRRLGKKLRDILMPPKDSGPSKEERRDQRLRDITKGFAYFDTFDELFDWTPEDVHQVQRANTPLLRRSAVASHSLQNPRANLVLCHDYHGGYHDYESIRPFPLKDELYSCKYLQYVDTFIYFSHKLVCCPPPTWINLLHRNGVKALGTFIVELQTPDVHRILECVNHEYVAAKHLASLADILGFDGWLLNIEKEFPSHIQGLNAKLSEFIEDLKRNLGPEKLVVWYDALNTDNEVEYQNSLSVKNAAFARSADKLLTNYKWTMNEIRKSKLAAAANDINCSDVSFGIDVWAQNTNMPGPPRITYPAEGGGGTSTGFAVSALAQAGFSATIFAPAWTYEHFSTSSPMEPDGSCAASVASKVDRSMWEGCSLPEELDCDCCKGKPHHTREYQEYPIVDWAVEHPAGSTTYFQTDFTQVFQRRKDGLHARLGSQAVLPKPLPLPVSHWKKAWDEDGNARLYGCYEGDSLCIRTEPLSGFSNEKPRKLHGEDDRKTHCASHLQLALFKLNMSCDRSLHAIIDCTTSDSANPRGFYFAYNDRDAETIEYQYKETQLGHTGILEAVLRHGEVNFRLVECGVWFEPMSASPVLETVLAINSLCIKPIQHIDARFAVTNVRVVRLKQDYLAESWLTWEWEGPVGEWPEGLPWSVTTGPFSHFAVEIGGQDVGSVHGLQFPLRKEDIAEVEEGKVSVMVRGYIFGESTARSTSSLVPLSDLRADVGGSDWSLIAEAAEGTD